MLEQWRAGLRASDALALEVSDLSLDANSPTLKVRSGKGRRATVVPVHPELADAFRMALSYGNVSEGRLIEVHRATAWRWVQSAVSRARVLGAIPPSRRAGIHQLRPSPAVARDPNRLPVSLVGTFINPDDADLPGAGAGPDREPGIGAVSVPADIVGVAHITDVWFESSQVGQSGR